MPASKRSPLALAILVLLDEAPMHTYGLQQLIRERGKEEVINVTQRTSLYQIVERLRRDGLLHAQAVSRDRNRPERTIYELTPTGRKTMLDWTRRILAKPSREFPEFPAAVSVLAVLTPKDALQQFELRITALQAEISRIEGVFATWEALPRLFLMEFEYLLAQVAAELRWVQAVTDDLRSGRLTWTKTSLKKMSKDFSSDLREKVLEDNDATTDHLLVRNGRI